VISIVRLSSKERGGSKREGRIKREGPEGGSRLDTISASAEETEVAKEEKVGCESALATEVRGADLCACEVSARVLLQICLLDLR